jgi:hypothetical protein
MTAALCSVLNPPPAILSTQRQKPTVCPVGVHQQIKLENSKNNFERNAEDVFFFEFPDLGSIPEIEIGHDNSGLMAGWHCAKVVIEDQTAKTRYVYPCDRYGPYVSHLSLFLKA